LLEQKIEIIDKSVKDYTIKAVNENEIIKVICKRGTKIIHSYNVNAKIWREIPNDGKLNYNRLLFLDKKVPAILLGTGISNIRSKLIDAEVRVIQRAMNE
jgi:hypothetical protein